MKGKSIANQISEKHRVGGGMRMGYTLTFCGKTTILSKTKVKKSSTFSSYSRTEELQRQTARRTAEGEVKQKLPFVASSLPLLADVFYLKQLP